MVTIWQGRPRWKKTLSLRHFVTKKGEEKSDTGHMSPDMWHLTYDTWHLTPDMGRILGDELSLKISAPHILRFGIDSVLKILNKRSSQTMNYLINYEGVYRTAPATQGLVNIIC